MSKLSQGNLFAITADELTRLSEDRPVSPQASPDSEEAPPMIAGSGLTFCAWCLQSNPCGCWRKILAESLALTLTEFNSANGLRVSLRLEVTNSCPSSWLLRTLARHTGASGYGSSGDWPTPLESDDHAKKRMRGNPNLPLAVTARPSPRATDGEKGGPNQRGSKGDLMLPSAVQQWPTPVVPNGGRRPKGGSMSLTGQTPDGKKRQVDLNYVVKHWPTPRASANENRTTRNAPSHGNGHGKTLAGEVIEMESAWPTPSARDWKDKGTEAAAQARKSPCLPASVVINGQHGPESHSTNGKNRESSLTGEQSFQFRYSMRIAGIGEVLLEWLVRSAARLNPRWVLQLMGFPSDWLDGVTAPSKPAEMRSSRNARKS